MAIPQVPSLQSSGGISIPHTLPGSSRASPKSQNCLQSSIWMQFTTRALAPRARKVLQPDRRADGQRMAEPYCTSLRTDQQSQTWFEKRMGGVRIGNQYGNLLIDSGATGGLRFVRPGMHVQNQRTASRERISHSCVADRFCGGKVLAHQRPPPMGIPESLI